MSSGLGWQLMLMGGGLLRFAKGEEPMDPEFGPQVKRLGSLPPSQQTIEKLNGSPPRTEKGRY
jgi:hypothetical protein